MPLRIAMDFVRRMYHCRRPGLKGTRRFQPDRLGRQNKVHRRCKVHIDPLMCCTHPEPDSLCPRRTGACLLVYPVVCRELSLGACRV